MPYDHAKLHRLYGSYNTYLRRYEGAKEAAVKQGYLLPEDRDELKAVAQPGDFEPTTRQSE